MAILCKRAQERRAGARGRRKSGDTKEPPQEKWKRHMEGDINGDMTGHILLEGGAPCWNRYASEETAAHG